MEEKIYNLEIKGGFLLSKLALILHVKKYKFGVDTELLRKQVYAEAGKSCVLKISVVCRANSLCSQSYRVRPCL